jgi:hypothetical protein
MGENSLSLSGFTLAGAGGWVALGFQPCDQDAKKRLALATEVNVACGHSKSETALVKVMRSCFRLRDAQRKNLLCPNVNHVVLVLQDALNHQKALGDQQHAILLQ